MKKENKNMNSLEEEVLRLKNENTTLKRQVAGYKGKILQMNRECEKYKTLDKEGDELNEKRIDEIERLKKQADADTEVKNNLTSSLDYLRGEMENKTEEVSELKGENNRLKSTIEDLENALGKKKKPWWKNLF